MKVRLSKNGTYTISGMTEDMFSALCLIMNTANDRCFDEIIADDNHEDGLYLSGDDFVCTLCEREREALREICKEL